MSQTQTPNVFAKPGRVRDYSPASDVYAGDIVIVGANAFLAANDIASSSTSSLGVNGTPVRGGLHADGIWRINRDASTFADGDAVYWNATGNPNVGTAGTGCATSTASGNTLIGQAVIQDGVADVNTNQYVDVLANVSKNTTTVGGSMTANDITGSDSILNITGQAGSASAGGAVPIAGGAGNGATNAGGATGLTGGAGGTATTTTGGAGGSIAGTGGAGGTATSGTGGAGGAGGATGGAGGNASTSGTGGAGGATVNNGGAGGTTATGTGGAGGTASQTGGAGGAASGVAGIGGAGGAVSMVAGVGGATSSTTSGISGVGGAVTITGGAGGACAATGAQASAAGGAVTITAGASGTVAGSTAAAAGGASTFASGAGGASSSTGAGGAGGAMAITGGVGGAGSATGTGGAGASITLTAGSGGACSGAGTGGAAGSINLVPGTGGTTSGGTAGANGGTYINRGVLAAVQVGLTLTSIGTSQSSTPTSAQLLGGMISQTGVTGAGTVTLPSGTALSLACPRTPVVGDTFDCEFYNLGGGQTLTITGATGTTVVGTAAVGSAKNAKLRFYNSGANTWNIYPIVSA